MLSALVIAGPLGWIWIGLNFSPVLDWQDATDFSHWTDSGLQAWTGSHSSGWLVHVGWLPAGRTRFGCR